MECKLGFLGGHFYACKFGLCWGTECFLVEGFSTGSSFDGAVLGLVCMSNLSKRV